VERVGSPKEVSRKGEEGIMRFMITCRIPVDKGNELAKTGSLGSTIQSIMEELEPEAAYFSDIQFATKLL
jgi:hypothetical protein